MINKRNLKRVVEFKQILNKVYFKNSLRLWEDVLSGSRWFENFQSK